MQYLKDFFFFVRERAKKYLAELLVWLETSVPRWRPILGTFAFLFFIELLFLYGGARIFAATYTFTQTSWSGGTSMTTAAHPGDQTAWNKYTSSSAITVGSTVSLAAASDSNPPPFSATGGTITYLGGYEIHTFTSSGTFTPSSSISDLGYLVVGGSGGGGGSPTPLGAVGGSGVVIVRYLVAIE